MSYIIPYIIGMAALSVSLRYREEEETLVKYSLSLNAFCIGLQIGVPFCLLILGKPVIVSVYFAIINVVLSLTFLLRTMKESVRWTVYIAVVFIGLVLLGLGFGVVYLIM